MGVGGEGEMKQILKHNMNLPVQFAYVLEIIVCRVVLRLEECQRTALESPDGSLCVLPQSQLGGHVVQCNVRRAALYSILHDLH